MVKTGRPKIYITNDELKEAHRVNSQRAYFKKHNINPIAHEIRHLQIAEKKKLAELKRLIKANLTTANLDKITQFFKEIETE